MKAQDCPKFGPLQGVKVVNLTMAIAGPFACSLLADLGAEVIGVESPRGRDTPRTRRCRAGARRWSAVTRARCA